MRALLPIIIIALRFDCVVCACAAITSNSAFMNSLAVGRHLDAIAIHIHTVVVPNTDGEAYNSQAKFNFKSRPHISMQENAQCGTASKIIAKDVAEVVATTMVANHT